MLAASVLAFRTIFLGLLGPVFYLFFAEFPVRAPLDQKLPWLKWVALTFSALIIFPGLRMGHPSLPNFVIGKMGGGNADVLISIVLYGLFEWGVFSLAENSFLAWVRLE